MNGRATRARNLGDSAIWNSSPSIAEQYNRAIDEYRTGEALLKDAQVTRLESKFKEVDAAAGRANADARPRSRRNSRPPSIATIESEGKPPKSGVSSPTGTD